MTHSRELRPKTTRPDNRATGPDQEGRHNYRPSRPPHVDRDFYEQVIAQSSRAALTQQMTIAPYSGTGLEVTKGQRFRIICPDGPQTADVALWNANDPVEKLDAMRTLLLEGWFIAPFSRLWSEAPGFRPLATCIGDTVDSSSSEEQGWHHHFVLNHCTPELWEMKTGRPYLNACRLNLLEAIAPWGLGEGDLSHCIAAHQKARLDSDTGFMYFAAVESQPGDYLELYAEVDLIVAVSVCPSGDGATVEPVPEKINVRPLTVEVYDTGTEPRDFPRWTDWRADWTGKWRP